MPKLKPSTILPTDEEDAAISAAISTDPDSPELTDANFANARPASEVLANYLGATETEALLRRRGRPLKADRKVDIKLRIDPDVVEALRSGGKGWQTRANEILRKGVGL